MSATYANKLGVNSRETFEENLEQLRASFKIDDKNINSYRKSVKFNLVSQWTAAEKADFNRNSKVCFEFNQLYPYIRNIIGEQLQNTPDILIRPRSNTVDDKKSDLIEGIVRYIGYASKLESILQQAAKCSLIGGWGAFYVTTDYEDEKSFNQCIKVCKLVDSTQAYFDPEAKDDCKEDGEYCGYVTSFDKKKFKANWPEIENPISIGTSVDMKRDNENGYQDEQIIVADHWRKEYYYKTLVQLSDGTELFSDEVEEYLEHYRQRMVAYKMQQLLAPQQQATVAPSMQGAPQPQQGMPQNPQQSDQGMTGAQPMPMQQGGMQEGEEGQPQDEEGGIFTEEMNEPTEVKRRKVKCCKIMYYKMIENALLDKREWPSSMLPVIYVPGDDFYIEGMRRTKSCTHYARDSQRFYNYTMSTLAEIMKQTRREQWLVDKTNVQSPDMQEIWRRPDQQQGALIYESNPVTGAKPEKVPTSELPLSWLQTTDKLEQSMQNIVGRHEASMGQPGSEISGIAVQNRIVQSSLGAYTYFDGINKATAHLGRILVDMIPRVYDTERDIPIMTRDKTHKVMGINKLITNKFSDTPSYENEISPDDKFDIEVSVGDIGPLQKQEALNALIKVAELPMTPQLSSILDKIAENLDVDNAKEIRDRWLDLMPPAIKSKVTGEPMPPPPPPQPNPQVQIAQMEMQVKMGDLQIKKSQREVELERIKLEYQQMQNEAQIKNQQAQVDIAKINQEAQLAGVDAHNQALRSATELASNHSKMTIGTIQHHQNMEKLALNSLIANGGNKSRANEGQTSE